MPQNDGYYIAAYVITGVIYAAYAFSLWKRSRRK